MTNWISTKDRLPNEEGNYLTACRFCDDLIMYDVSSFGKIRKKGMRFFEYDEAMIKRVIEVDAWMPIEPYTGVEDRKSDGEEFA